MDYVWQSQSMQTVSMHRSQASPFHPVTTQGNLSKVNDLSEVFTGLFVAVQVGLLLHGSSHFQVRLFISPLLHTCPSSGLPFLCLKSNLPFSFHLVYSLLS